MPSGENESQIRIGCMYSLVSFPRLALAQSVGPDRHLRADCDCGAFGVVDPSPWVAARLGGHPLRSFQTRLRCLCGAENVSLEVWHQAAEPDGSIVVIR